MPIFIALLVLAVALGRGGYDPWAVLTLEIGAAMVIVWAVFEIVRGTGSAERAAYKEKRRAWKRLPFLHRHAALASWVRLLSLGRFPKKLGRPDVEIVPPGTPLPDETKQAAETHLVVLGYPFNRTGIGIPVFLLTLWIVASIIPLERGVLEIVSPQAHFHRTEAESLIVPQAEPSPAPWSLAPYLTFVSLWLWLAYLALFYASVHLAAKPKRVERLSELMVALCVGFGIWGVGQWFLGIQALVGADSSASELRATGSFGNRNHYAAFMEMLFLCSLGWLGSRWARLSTARGTRSRIHALAQESGAKLFLAGLGIVLSALAIVFSLSRSGITAALIGCGVFAVLVRPTGESQASQTIELGRSERGRERGYLRGKRSRFGHVYWAVALTVLAVAIWIGIDPVVSRFELVPEEWEAEQGRGQVWMDSLETAEDYWLTGSGLSSFRYVYPRYRSFGGRISYSWAHNDYLQALIELGVPGLLLILWIMVGVWKGARRVRHRLSGNSGDLPLLHLHAGYCAAAVAVALHSFTDFGLHLAANGALLGVIVGVVLGLGGGRKE